MFKKRRTLPDPELVNKLTHVQNAARDLTRVRAIFSTTRVLLQRERASDGEKTSLSLLRLAQLVRRAVRQVSVCQSFMTSVFDSVENKEAGPTIEDIVVEQLSISLESENTDLVSDLIVVIKPLQDAISGFDGNGDLNRSKQLVEDIGNTLARIEQHRLQLLESLRTLEALGLDTFQDAADELERVSSGLGRFDPRGGKKASPDRGPRGAAAASLDVSPHGDVQSTVGQAGADIIGKPISPSIGQLGGAAGAPVATKLGNLASIGSSIAKVRRQLKGIAMDQSKLCVYLSEATLLCTGVNAGEVPDESSKRFRKSMRKAITKLRAWNPSQQVHERMHFIQERFRLRSNVVADVQVDLSDKLPPELREVEKELMDDESDSDHMSDEAKPLPAEEEVSQSRRRRITQKLTTVLGIVVEDQEECDADLSLSSGSSSGSDIGSAGEHSVVSPRSAAAGGEADTRSGARATMSKHDSQGRHRTTEDPAYDSDGACPTAGSPRQPPDSGAGRRKRPNFRTQPSTLNGEKTRASVGNRCVPHTLPPAPARPSAERSPRKPVAVITPHLDGSSWRRLGPAGDDCSDTATQRTMTNCVSWESLPGCFSHAADIGDARAAERRARDEGACRWESLLSDFPRLCAVRFDFESDDGFDFAESSVPTLPPVPPSPTRPITPRLLTATRPASGRHAGAGSRGHDLAGHDLPSRGRTTRLVVIDDALGRHRKHCPLARAVHRDPSASDKSGCRSGAIAKETRSRACFGHKGAGSLEVQVWGWEHGELCGREGKCVVPSLPFG